MAPLLAQDASQQILLNQQIQQAQQATQQSQQANMDAMRASQQAAQDASNAVSTTRGDIARPRFSLKPGSFNSPQLLRLSDSTRGSTIYYTTDGWLPTPASTPYEGPITIDATTHVEAIAYLPNWGSSEVADATAQATVLHVDRKGAAGAPGVLTFRVDYMKVQGVTIPLLATDTTQGKNNRDKVLPLFLIPVVGAAALAVHGDNVEILRGTPVTARIAQDTRILPGS